MSSSDNFCKIQCRSGISSTLCAGGLALKDANTELIRQAINEFNWQRSFLNTNVNEKVDIFNSAILNIFSNFIPQEFAVCDDNNPP